MSAHLPGGTLRRLAAGGVVLIAALAAWLALGLGGGLGAAGPLASYRPGTEPIWGSPASLSGRLSLADARPGPSNVIPPGRAAIHVPILMYHYIRVNPDPRDVLGYNLSVTPANFAQQMDWLAANGYQAITLADLRRYLLDSGVLPARPVVLSFDDGYADFYSTAYPVLRTHNFTAVSYVVSGFLGQQRYMSQAEVEDLDANGIEIGAHTVSHPDLTRLRYSDLVHEVQDCKLTLEALVRHPVLDFAYPSGRYNGAVIQAVQRAGFQSATTTQPGSLHSAADRFTWTRVRVSGGEALPQFVRSLAPDEPWVAGTLPSPSPSQPALGPPVSPPPAPVPPLRPPAPPVPEAEPPF